ncbi:MAG TPA: polysaccharide biosynthesis C-terminal domain-containing protein [Solirubrobacteraceae bacterium]|jgi:O-antigen/teichoic acid export membrane protein|nr:polysaccharide biosynthesis C-terminal domain-containing protein [Solirubrobacteraceae bacterium]
MSAAATAPARERGLRSDVLLMLGAKVCVLVFGAATTIIVARSLGPAGRGSLASIYALMTLVVQLGTFGVTSANPYFAAREPHLRARIAGNSLWLAGVLGPAMAALAVAIKLLAPGALGGIGWAELSLGMLAVPIMLSSLFLQSILLAEGRTVLYNAVDVGVALATLLLVGVVLPLAGGGVLLALSLLVAPQALALLIFVSAMRRHGPLRRPLDRALALRMIGYGARAYAVTLLAYLLIRIDLLLVNGIQGARAAGQYSIAVAVADALELLPLAVCVNLFARAARRSADRDASLGVFHRIAVGYLVVCALAAALADPAITLLFGHAYHPAIALLLWLLPGVYCLGLLNVIAYYFAAHGMPRELALVWVPGLAINLALNLALLPHHGTYVASLASSLAYALVLALHLRMFARDLGGWSRLRPTVAGMTSE